jgi:nucleotide-binding universal stress UspA family protein
MPTRRIVIGLDGSAGAAAAVEWCAEVGTALDAEVIAVNAVSPRTAMMPGSSPAEVPAIVDDSALEATIHEEMATELEDWCAPLREAGVFYHSYVVDGGVIDALLGVAEEVAADLVVVGREKHGGLKEKILGSVPNHLTHHAHCPVVVVPAE